MSVFKTDKDRLNFTTNFLDQNNHKIKILVQE